MKTPSEGPSGFRDEETSRGGADAVEKTTYVTGHTTDPRAEPPEGASAVPAVNTGGMGALAWVLIVLAIAIALYLGASVFM
jgi:hypothetical protein